MASTSDTNPTQRQGTNVSEAVTIPNPSVNKSDNEANSSVPKSYSTSEMSNISSSLPSDYDSRSLNPRVTFQRALSSIYNRWMKVIIIIIY